MVARKRKYALPVIFNAILYVLKNSCIWRDLPKDFPTYGRVFWAGIPQEVDFYELGMLGFKKLKKCC